MLTTQDNGQAVPCWTIKGMRKLLEKYYNILYYCEYNLLFFILKSFFKSFLLDKYPKMEQQVYEMYCIKNR